jgi:hypothetical protein
MNTALLGREFYRQHPASDKNEMRLLRIVGLGFWGNDPVADCLVIEGEGTTAMVYISELPQELQELNK